METGVFDYRDPSELLRGAIRAQPRKGRGLVKELAAKLGVASQQISQFLSGTKTPSVDQAFLIARHLKWNELETEYYLTLIEFERAGHHETRAHFAKKLARIKQESIRLTTSVSNTQELDDKHKAEFYSSWIYSALRLYCSIGDGKTHQELTRAFPEFEGEIDQLIEFLLRAGLLKRTGNRYEIGVARTFVPKGSPFLPRHHGNWRMRAAERAAFITDDELMFTAPMSISASGFKTIRKELQAWVKSISERLPELGDAEEVVCLNIDFFRLVKK